MFRIIFRKVFIVNKIVVYFVVRLFLLVNFSYTSIFFKTYPVKGLTLLIAFCRSAVCVV